MNDKMNEPSRAQEITNVLTNELTKSEQMDD